MYNTYPNYFQPQQTYPQQSNPNIIPNNRPIKRYDIFGNPYWAYDEHAQQTQYSQNQPIAPQPAAPQQNALPSIHQQTKASPPFMLVENEQQAQDYEIDINNVGVIHLFALKDDTALYAKRINPSNFEKEFATYVKVPEDNSHKKQPMATAAVDNEVVNSIDGRLKKIEQFVDSASLLLLGAGNMQTAATDASSVIATEAEQPRTRRTIKKDGSNNAEED